MLLTITAWVAGIYLLIGIIITVCGWKSFRQAVINRFPDPNLTMPPPWLCWLLCVVIWPGALIKPNAWD